MTIRESIENREYEYLSKRAAKAKESKGRKENEIPCNYRTDFQRDRDRILHAKAFRRLAHKTQVFLNPEGDHYRTRMTHSLEVSQISRAVSRGLRLNEDLTEAIALGHDMGHAPFGHAGEDALNSVHKGGFEHREQSLRVADYIEKRNEKSGLNLTQEVRDGILNHSGPKLPFTLEAQVVRLCDRVAYINHDLDDSIRAGFLSPDKVPSWFIDHFGNESSKRIGKMITDIIIYSEDKDIIGFDKVSEKKFLDFRSFMFENVYKNKIVKKEIEKVSRLIHSIYKYYEKNPDLLPEEHKKEYEIRKKDAIRDYIAGMTDRFAIHIFKEVMIPNNWR